MIQLRKLEPFGLSDAKDEVCVRYGDKVATLHIYLNIECFQIDWINLSKISPKEIFSKLHVGEILFGRGTDTLKLFLNTSILVDRAALTRGSASFSSISLSTLSFESSMAFFLSCWISFVSSLLSLLSLQPKLLSLCTVSQQKQPNLPHSN